MDGDRRRAMTSARWSRVVKFTVADVDLNARGRLSRRQRLRCAARGAIAFAIAFVAAAEAVFAVRIAAHPRPLPPSSAGLILHLAACVAVSLGAAYYGSSFLQDAVAGRAAVAIGPLQFVWKVDARGKVRRHLSCDGRRFDVRAGCREAIEDDAVYRVYYAACSERLLSLETTGPLPKS
ncbi:MAG TPA: hypothetical protein VN962_23635 [Polyangia bacterium]|nr:hypothetical protein [Polyangia bacterium]